MKLKVLVMFITVGGAFGAWRMSAEAQAPAAATAELQTLLDRGYEVKAAAAGSGDASPALFVQAGAAVYQCYFDGKCTRWPRK